MIQSPRLVIFKTAGHGKSQIDNLHGFPAQVMREHEALDQILSVSDLVNKCEAAEMLARIERKESMIRCFVNLDQIEQFYVQKSIKTAAKLKIRLVFNIYEISKTN